MTSAFEDTDLALCVLQALVEQGLVRTSIRIPELEPDEDDDLDDESESWRDRLENNQTEPIERLVALLDRHRDLLPQVEEISGLLIDVAEYDYEPSFWSLAGIEACTGLKSISIWTHSKLDLEPLVSLPALIEVDLSLAHPLPKLEPLLRIGTLQRVIGPIDAAMAKRLRANGVEVGE